ncbi:MAG: hypothetical protein J7604_23780 [Sporocytophaga sp.]|uniref:DUF6756 family protein n=1 Tax=Sporocytophaga sp. TaxID=2231183 RepID=UPI001B0A941F|nr:DUF6756 family protein [Sporocytophaga sp.]MBO9703256.1 hypothetical protein [Sporocytophaga sp.]
MEKLDKDRNYWIVIVLGENPSDKHYIYDSKVNPILDLLSISTNDFYLVDKRYDWFLYFHRTPHSDEVSIYKSKSTITPLG